MSDHHESTTNQAYQASDDTESDIAAKRSELRVLWDEISVRDPSASTKPQSATADDCASRFHQLVKVLQRVDRTRHPPYINKLPDELLYEIFFHILSLLLYRIWDYYWMDSLRSDYNFEALQAWQIDGPLILSKVCKRWQAIMLSSPSLWSTLVIGAEHLEPEYLQLFLYLSHEHPLTLIFDDLLALNGDVLLALQPHAHRIQHMHSAPVYERRWNLDILHDGVTMVFHCTGLDPTLHIPTKSFTTLNFHLKRPPLDLIGHFQHLQHLVIYNEINLLSLIPEHNSLPSLRLLVLHKILDTEPTSGLRHFAVQRLQVLHLHFLKDISYKEFVSLQSYICGMPSLISIKLAMNPLAQDWVEYPPSPELVSLTIQHVCLEWDRSGNSPLQFIAGVGSLRKLSLWGSQNSNALQ